MFGGHGEEGFAVAIAGVGGEALVEEASDDVEPILADPFD